MRKIIYCLLSMATAHTVYGADSLALQPNIGEQSTPPIKLTVTLAPFDSRVVDKLLLDTNKVPENNGIVLSINQDHCVANGNPWKPMTTKLMYGGQHKEGFDILADIQENGITNNALLVLRNTASTRSFTGAWAAGQSAGPVDLEGHPTFFSWLLSDYIGKHNLQVATFEWDFPLPITWQAPLPDHDLENKHDSTPRIVDFEPIHIKKALDSLNPRYEVVASVNSKLFIHRHDVSWVPLLAKLARGYDMLVDEDAGSRDAKGHRLIREGFFVMANNQKTHDFIDKWGRAEPMLPGETRDGHTNIFSWLLAESRKTNNLIYDTLEWAYPLPVIFSPDDDDTVVVNKADYDYQLHEEQAGNYPPFKLVLD